MQTAETDTTLQVNKNITDFNIIEHLRLHVTFDDGLKGEVIFKKSGLTGVFEPLKQQDKFNEVFLCHGVLSWPWDIDICSDKIYQDILNHGISEL